MNSPIKRPQIRVSKPSTITPASHTSDTSGASSPFRLRHARDDSMGDVLGADHGLHVATHLTAVEWSQSNCCWRYCAFGRCLHMLSSAPVRAKAPMPANQYTHVKSCPVPGSVAARTMTVYSMLCPSAV